MFFSIGNCTHPSLTQYAQNLWLDQGWKQYNNIFYKGYCLQKDLLQKVKEQDFSQQQGNYTVIDCNTTSLHYDNTRSYPLYFNKHTVSNIFFDGSEPVWFDNFIKYKHHWQWDIQRMQSFSDVQQDVQFGFDHIVDSICEILLNSCKKLHTDLPLIVPDTRGVDTTCLRSALDYLGKDYTLVAGKRHNKEHGWGFSQLLDLSYAHVQITGFCGDECLLRNPKYCQNLLDPHDVDLCKEFDKIKHSYMKKFFEKHYRRKIVHTDQHAPTAKKHVRNMILNDFQIWHKDHTITFTPYRDIELVDIALCADADTILRQVTDAEISFEIIKRLNPKNINDINKNKNGVIL